MASGGEERRIRNRLDDKKFVDVHRQTESHLELVAGGTATTVQSLVNSFLSIRSFLKSEPHSILSTQMCCVACPCLQNNSVSARNRMGPQGESLGDSPSLRHDG